MEKYPKASAVNIVSCQSNTPLPKTNLTICARKAIIKTDRGIIKKKWKIQWGDANGRTRQLLMFDKKLWALMEKSSCKSILIGAESGSQEMLDLVGKDTSPEDTVKFSNTAREHNIEVVFSLMVGIPKHPDYLDKKKSEAGVKKEIRDILEMLEKSLPEKKYHAILLFVYTPYPGNPLFETSKKCGFKSPGSLEEWANFEIVANNVPWVSKKNYAIAQQLMDFIFPYACGKNKNRMKSPLPEKAGKNSPKENKKFNSVAFNSRSKEIGYLCRANAVFYLHRGIAFEFQFYF